MAKIFLSYRRQDSAGAAGRIFDRLRAHFGDGEIFMDIDSIPFGEDFRRHIDNAVGQCDVVLAVIGPGWSGKTETSRRIDEPRDFVRIELESALQRGIPVIPVLLDRTRMPTEAEMPPSLAGLAFRNAIEVDQGRDFHPHVDRLVRGIEFQFKRAKTAAVKATAPKVPITHRLWLYSAALPVLALLGIIIHIVTKPPTKGLDGTKKKEVAVTSAAFETKSVSPTAKVPSPERSRPQHGLEWTNSIGMKLVRIDPGEFLMGTTKDQVDQLIAQFSDSERIWFDDEQPQHPVKISRSFYLGIHEITQGQYQTVMGKAPSQFKGSDDLPVESVSWLDAVAFCNKLSEREQRTPFYRIDGDRVTIVGENGYRLPTEAEWEYACRAKSESLYTFGDDAGKLGEYAWYGSNAEGKTHPVGQKLPNAWGLYDMLGNVWEWCADGYDKKYYASSPTSGPPGASGASLRVIRGGAWGVLPRVCRPADRSWNAPGFPDGGLGFRVAAVQE